MSVLGRKQTLALLRVEYHLENIDLKGVWTGPGALELNAHALAPVAELPVEVISTTHLIADLTLGLGTVVHDYLDDRSTVRMRRFGELRRNPPPTDRASLKRPGVAGTEL